MMEHIPPDDNQTREIYRHLQTHCDSLVGLQQEAQLAYKRIDQEKDLTSSQCTRFIRPLLPSPHPVTTLKNILAGPLHIQSIDTQRLQLLIGLDQINSSLQQLQYQATLLSQIGIKSLPEEARNIRKDLLETLQNIEQRLSQFTSLLIHTLNTTASQELRNNPDTPSQMVSSLVESSPPLNLPTLPPRLSSIGHTHTAVKRNNASSRNHLHLAAHIKSFFRGMLEHFFPTSSSLHSPIRQEIPLDTSSSLTEVSEQYRRQILYTIAQKYIEPLELEEICMKLNIDYTTLTGTNHAEKALSLTERMYKKQRLDDLERELRKVVPKRFPSSESNNL